MNNYKNYLIALLTGLLALSLSTQPSNGAPVKTYDAVKLAEYSACINANNNWQIAFMHVAGGNGNLTPGENVLKCRTLKP
jgi:hypothetical protein